MFENVRFGAKILCGFGIVTFVLITAMLTLVGQATHTPHIRKRL